MIENEGVNVSAQQPPEEQAESGHTTSQLSSEQGRSLLIKRIVLFGSILSAGVVGLYVLLYFQTGAWQLLAIAGFALLSIICLVLAGWSIRRGKLDAAGYLILVTAAVSYGGGELVLANATLYITLGSILVIILAGNVVLPRKWGAWLVTVALFGAYVWLVNRLEPLPRYDVVHSAIPPIATLSITVLFALVLLWQITRALRIGTIRTRLLVAFVSLVSLLGVTISISVFVGGLQFGQQRTINQLGSVATLKEVEVNNWVQNLQADLGIALTGEDTIWRLRILLQKTPDLPVFRQDAHDRLQAHLDQVAGQLFLFKELFLMDLQGQVILSTDTTQEGKLYDEEPFFQQGLEGSHVYLTRYPSQPPTGMSVVVVRPIIDERGHTLGVLAGRANMAVLNEMMLERAGLGETGETYLVNSDHTQLTELRFAAQGEADKIYFQTEGVNTALEAHINGSGLYDGYRGVPVVGVYRWLPALQVALVAEQDQSEAFRSTYTMLGIIGGVALAAVIIAVVASLFITQSIATPIADLVETAEQIAAGDLELVAKLEREDETGALARAFNSMTAQLRGLISSLEQRVANRTRELERRATHLQAAADVGHAAAAILNPDELLPQVAHLIGERFGFYHVGIFLLDETGEYAMLRASNSEGGQQMLAQGHKLKVGEEGIVGYVTGTGEPRIALDVGRDAVHFRNPFLPQTRSEMTLPLVAGNRVLGALDVQSTQEAAFIQEDVAVLQVLSDQVAVALENARLFAENQAALEATRRAYGELSRRAWTETVSARPGLGFRSDASGVTSAGEIWRPEMEQALHEGQTIQCHGEDTEAKIPLAIPIKVRDQVVGVLDTFKAGDTNAWTAEEIALLETMTDQLGVALESARLFEETIEERDHTALLLEISQQLSTDLEFDALVTTVLSFADRLGAEAAELYVTDIEQETYFFKSTLPERATLTGEEARRFSKLILNQGLEGWVLRERQPALVSDTKHDSRWLILPGHEEEDPVRSVISVPLVAGRGHIQGVLSLTQRYPGAFGHTDMNLAMSLATQTAVALENVSLFQATQAALEETDALYRASRAVAAADSMDDIVRAITHNLPSPEVDQCFLAIFDRLADQPSEELAVVAAWSQNTKKPYPVGARLSLAQDLVGDQVSRDRPLILSDVAAEKWLADSKHAELLATDIRSWAVIPLVAVGGWIGVLSVTASRPGAITERNLQPYLTLAGQVANAIQNARLYEEVQTAYARTKEERDRLESLHDTMVAIEQATTVEHKLRLVVDGLQGVGYGRVALTLRDDQLQATHLTTAGMSEDEETWLWENMAPPKVWQQRLSVQFDRFRIGRCYYLPWTDPDVPTLVGKVLPGPQPAPASSEADRWHPNDLLYVPMYGSANQLIGIISLDDPADGQRPTLDSLRIIELFAQEAALALENARLLQQAQQRARREALIREISAKVSSSMDLKTVLQTTVRELSQALGASQAIIHMGTPSAEPRLEEGNRVVPRTTPVDSQDS